MPSSKARKPRSNRRRRRRGLLDRDAQLVVVVAHTGDLAPRLSPPFVVRLPGGIHDPEAIAQRGGAAELESERRGKHQRAALAGNGVGEPSLTYLDADFGAPVGRGHPGLGRERQGRGRVQKGQTSHVEAGKPAHDGIPLDSTAW